VDGTLLARLGDAVRLHKRTIAAMQWSMVLAYAILLVVPAMLAMPGRGASIVNDLTLFSRFVFWGIWWPGAIAGMLLFGRVWCGLLCPEGTLTEFASRHGRRKYIPKLVRWPAWPFVAFLLLTIYGQLIGVYEYPKAMLLILGTSTAAAVAIGYLYGSGKRVWCRYLCPVTGVFGLLARLSPIHFAVDRAAWDRYPIRVAPIDCAPMLDVKHMRSAAQCQNCGRCSGYRGAVGLALRSPNREIADTSSGKVSTPEGLLLVYGMLGIALGALQWKVSPMFASLRQQLAEGMLARSGAVLLQDKAPWWLLVHYPEIGVAFSWLDGLSIVAYIVGNGVVVGGLTHFCMSIAARLSGSPRLDWKVLALALLPMAATSLFVGLTMFSVAQLRTEGIVLAATPYWRATLLIGGTSWSCWLAFRLLASGTGSVWRRASAWLCMALPCAVVDASWYLVFFTG
jgi:polyferredoxin